MTRADSLADAEVDALIERLWPEGDRLDGPQVHAVLDAARDPRIIGLLAATGLERCCLFAGALSPSLHAAAPHLVHLSSDGHFTREVLRHGWGRSWGVLTIAPPDVTLLQLRRHLRTLLRVQDNTGRTLMFRFYDPRVMRTYLPTCSPAEVHQVFGPVHHFVCESGHSGGVLDFDRDELTCREHGGKPMRGGPRTSLVMRRV